LKEQPGLLYDGQAQMAVQQALVTPTEMWGFIPFINPPHAAWFFSLFSFIPYGWGFAIWSALNFISLGLAASWIGRSLVPESFQRQGLESKQMIFLTGAFMAVVEGALVGQNHGVSLLLAAGTVIFSLQKKPWQAGLLAGFMIYKPQFVISILILWLAWQDWRALAGFALSAGAWVGITLLGRGLEPFLAYAHFLPQVLQAIALKGMGGYLELTIYGLLLGIFGAANWQPLSLISQALMVLGAVALGWHAWRQRKEPVETRLTSWMLALLFPLVVTPHAQLHDAVALIAFFALWLRWKPSRKLLYATIAVFLGAFFLPFLTHYLNFPLLAFIPLGLAVVLLWEISSTKEQSTQAR
jgi:hypothetical protein